MATFARGSTRRVKGLPEELRLREGLPDRRRRARGCEKRRARGCERHGARGCEMRRARDCERMAQGAAGGAAGGAAAEGDMVKLLKLS
jgi:hypothetical protein